MVWLGAFAAWRDPGRLAAEVPELWRHARRFNLPVQLALGAAHEVARSARSIADAALISLAPCRPGSTELNQTALRFESELAGGGPASPVRINPTFTLHAVDNLALSALAIATGNHAYGICLGGAAGQAWRAIEIAIDRLGSGADDELVVFGGDQDLADGHAHGAGAAALLCAQPRSVLSDGRAVEIVAVERAPAPGQPIARADAARGLLGWWDAVREAAGDRVCYRVPDQDGDGIDAISVIAQVTP